MWWGVEIGLPDETLTSVPTQQMLRCNGAVGRSIRYIILTSQRLQQQQVTANSRVYNNLSCRHFAIFCTWLQSYMCKWCGTRYCKECKRGDFQGFMKESTKCRICNQVNSLNQYIIKSLSQLMLDRIVIPLLSADIRIHVVIGLSRSYSYS